MPALFKPLAADAKELGGSLELSGQLLDFGSLQDRKWAVAQLAELGLCGRSKGARGCRLVVHREQDGPLEQEGRMRMCCSECFHPLERLRHRRTPGFK